MSRHGKVRRGPQGKRRKGQVKISKPRHERRAKHAARRAARPPSPRRPARRTVLAKTATVDESAVARVKRDYERLQSNAGLSNIFDAIGRIDEQLRDLPHTLDTLRERGYVHGGDLDDRLADLEDEWDEIESRVRQTLEDERRAIDRDITNAKFIVSQAERGRVDSAENRIDTIENRIRTAQRNLQSLYGGIQKSLKVIKQQLHAADELLDWVEESAEIDLLPSEGPVTGTEAQWLRDGEEEGPTGILILTDQRLLFEQREKIVTRRLLGIFARESEVRQTLLLDIDEVDIEAVSADEKKGRFGFGSKEIIRLTGTPTADFSRLAFLLKDSEADDWTLLLRRVMNGDIDKDRDEAFVEEMLESAEIAAAFPTACPNCLATLPIPQRGDTTLTCEFCGSTVRPA